MIILMKTGAGGARFFCRRDREAAASSVARPRLRAAGVRFVSCFLSRSDESAAPRMRLRVDMPG
ncbi:hypothetical protein [Burkholderia oklahomensis]|uniref:hypothetical protein n=1 Tax=Burkholderia oklahomensis TaxID=342113 RepID=UPI0002FB8A88|nr:hypothetical protein [Burkholderia oklahomensis]MBI0361783.1 hypothetical protein [Burkholderia oklahomensis]